MLFKLSILCAGLLVTGFNFDSTVNVEKFGRRIQLDGFLIEWNAQSTNVWNGTQNWYFDVVNTPEGLAGYFRSDSSVSCRFWDFTFNSSFNENKIHMSIPSDGNGVYKYDRKLYDSIAMISIEWLIPWERTGLDSSGEYSLLLTGNSRCGDSLQALMITGNKSGKENLSLKYFVLQMLLIILLIVIYILLAIKIRNRTKKLQMKKTDNSI